MNISQMQDVIITSVDAAAPKMELWIPQTSEIGVLKSWVQQELWFIVLVFGSSI